MKEFSFLWQWHLKSSPEKLWPYISDTNRFDHDALLPPVKRILAQSVSGVTLGVRVIQKMGLIQQEWVEEPFEWNFPERFGVTRKFIRGPFEYLRVLTELKKEGQGTLLCYHLSVKPRYALLRPLIPLIIEYQIRPRFERVAKKYDDLASKKSVLFASSKGIPWSQSELERLYKIEEALMGAGESCQDLEVYHVLVKRMFEWIRGADDMSLGRIRPYPLADAWNAGRQDVLGLCLQATRAGLLELSWNVLCPMCRVAKQSVPLLSQLKDHAHCDVCRFDGEIDFEKWVEVVFRLNEAIRPVQSVEYCIGNPQMTPHVLVQKMLEPQSESELDIRLVPGKYRWRVLGKNFLQDLTIEAQGLSEAMLTFNGDTAHPSEMRVGGRTSWRLRNQSREKQLFLLEKTAWLDEALTARDVILTQKFRDLFSKDILRIDQKISVGSLAVLFTDLKGSTSMYREVGDASAFGLVMNHFDILKEHIQKNGGIWVKTIGDAVMAAFKRPLGAILAIQESQDRLKNIKKERPLMLKAGIHYGPAIAVSLNDQIDYFGTTINLASRLEHFSTGEDIIISNDVKEDPEVRDFLKKNMDRLLLNPLDSALKGFGDERFELWRLMRKIK